MRAVARVEVADWAWTWGEFKALVESTGASDDTKIGYIDISNNGFSVSILIVRNELDELEIT